MSISGLNTFIVLYISTGVKESYSLADIPYVARGKSMRVISAAVIAVYSYTAGL
jgi:Na+-translocating ferredoxin:NAD+ oxidoreductase RnfA subunit